MPRVKCKAVFDIYEEMDLEEPGVSYVYVAYYADIDKEESPSDCEWLLVGADPDDL